MNFGIGSILSQNLFIDGSCPVEFTVLSIAVGTIDHIYLRFIEQGRYGLIGITIVAFYDPLWSTHIQIAVTHFTFINDHLYSPHSPNMRLPLVNSIVLFFCNFVNSKFVCLKGLTGIWWHFKHIIYMFCHFLVCKNLRRKFVYKKNAKRVLISRQGVTLSHGNSSEGLL